MDNEKESPIKRHQSSDFELLNLNPQKTKRTSQLIVQPILQDNDIQMDQIEKREKHLYQMKITADLINQKQFFALMFMILIFAIVIISLSNLLPPTLISPQVIDLCQQDFQNGNSFENKYCLSGQQSVRQKLISGLEEKNQLLQIYAQFSFNILPNIALSYINYTASLFGVQKGDYNQQQLYEQLIVGHEHSLQANCDIDQEYIIYNRNETQAKNEKVKKKCQNFLLIYVPQIQYSSYLLIINFTDITLPSQSYRNYFPLSDVQLDLEYYTVNSSFTEKLIITRYTFLAISLLFLSYYCYRIRKFKLSELQVEQKFVLVLSISQCLFNDPFYAILIEKPNIASSVIDIILICNFICGLLLFWMVQFEIILYSNNNKYEGKYFYHKGILVIFLWIFLIGSYIILTLDYIKDPTSRFYDNNSDLFFAFKLISLMILASISIYYIISTIIFFYEYNTRIRKYQIIGFINFYYVFLLIIELFFGSLDGLLNGTSLFIIISIFNVYIYLQQILWYPLQKNLIQKNIYNNKNIIKEANDIIQELENNDEFDCDDEAIVQDDKQIQ